MADVTLNLLVALITGSVVMLSQSLQGLSDLVTAGVLFYGVHRSKRAPDTSHPFGYGREIFFWVMIAGIFMFFGTGALSIFLGIEQLRNPEPVTNLLLAFGMLTFGFSTNLYAFAQSVKRLNQAEGTQSWWRRFIASGMAETKATFLVDFLGTAAALLGLFALSLLALTGNASFDGLGGILIGASMMLGSLLLMYDVKDLIVGRAVPESTNRKIIDSVMAVSGIKAVLDLRTMYLGSSKLLVIVEVHMDDALNTDQIEALTDTIKQSIRDNVPHAYRIQIEVETPDSELV